MLDRPARRLLAPALDAAARRLERAGLHPNAVTLAGLIVLVPTLILARVLISRSSPAMARA